MTSGLVQRQICNVCKSDVRRNQSKVKCISCKNFFHTFCVSLPFSRHQRKKWQCGYCISRLEELPLFNLSDNEFHSALGNEISNNGNMPYDVNELNNIFRGENISPVNEYMTNQTDIQYNFQNAVYLTSEEVDTLCDDFDDLCNFTSLCVNVRSIQNIENLTRFQALVASLSIKPSIIAINETWLSDTDFGPHHQLPDYNFIHNHRTKGRGGGVGIYIQSSLPYTVRNDLSVMKNKIFESLFVDLHFRSKTITAGTIYRSPLNNSSEVNDFFGTLKQKLRILKNNYRTPCYILGDLNFDLNDLENRDVNSLKECMHNNYFISLINQPTRITDSTATCIDHIWTNVVNSDIRTGIICDPVADHLATFQVTNFNEYISPLIENDLFFDQVDYDKLYDNLSNENFEIVFQENQTVDSMFECFYKIIQRNLKQVTTTKRITNNKYDHQWHDKELKKLKRKKEAMYKKAKNNSEFKQASRSLQKDYEKMIKRKKISYYQGTFSKYKNDIKRTWGTLNSLLGRKRKDVSLCLKNDDQIVFDK